MTRQVTATEVKARLLALLDEVAKGETIEITMHGRGRGSDPLLARVLVPVKVVARAIGRD